MYIVATVFKRFVSSILIKSIYVLLKINNSSTTYIDKEDLILY